MFKTNRNPSVSYDLLRGSGASEYRHVLRLVTLKLFGLSCVQTSIEPQSKCINSLFGSGPRPASHRLALLVCFEFEWQRSAFLLPMQQKVPGFI